MMHRIFAFAVPILAMTFFHGTASAQGTVLFDSITGGTTSFTGGLPRSNIGSAFNMDPSLPAAPIAFNRMVVRLVESHTVATSYLNTRIRVQFWDTASLATTGTTPAFSNPVSFEWQFTTGAFNAPVGSFFIDFTLDFASDIVLNGPNNHGVSVNWQGDVGAGFVNTDNLTSAIRAATSPPLAVGSIPFVNGGFYRNASVQPDLNFIGSDFRQFAGGDNDMPMFQLIAVPEPTTIALFSLGVCASIPVISRWRRKREGISRARSFFNEHS